MTQAEFHFIHAALRRQLVRSDARDKIKRRASTPQTNTMHYSLAARSLAKQNENLVQFI
jgi:hypothetical protein